MSWDTSSHEFRIGQWFKGRIYERRCDLSPSGEKLIYFAAKHRAPLFTWTAVSRPPFLTALAMWPKGDSWGGGGLFRNERTISLNHLKGQFELTEDFQFPRSMTVEPCGVHSGRGEDGPILHQRLTRDGWSLRQNAEGWANRSRSRIRYEPSKKETWVKSRGGWTLEMSIVGIHERDGPWYVMQHRILDAQGGVAIDLERSDWADWSMSGELLFARQGRLYRLTVKEGSRPGVAEELIDLSELKFEAVQTPAEASLWKGRAPRGRVLLSAGLVQQP